MRCQFRTASMGLGTVVMFAIASSAQAAILSINFVGGGTFGGQSMLSTDQAGDPAQSLMVPNWNNAAGTAGTVNDLMLSDGTGGLGSGYSVTWDAAEQWALPDTTSGNNIGQAGGSNGDGMQNPKMMKGFIGAQGTSATTDATVTVSGIQKLGSTYDVVVYFDGENAGFWRTASYAIGATTLTGEDSENVNFNSGSGNNANGIFQLPVAGGAGNLAWPNSPNNSEGNYFKFTGLTGTSFTLTVTAGAAATATQRAALNGIQVIGVVVPEPSTFALAGLGLLGLVAARRRRK